MNNCKELKLGEPGRAYIRECLECGKKLGTQLLTLLNREQGQITALLPQDVDSRKMLELTVEEFNYGGISQVGGALSCLTMMIQEFLATDSSHICIIEDVIVRREDAWISWSNAPILFLGSDVYYFLSSKHRNDWGEIRKTVSTLDAHRVTGILTSLPTGRNPLSEKQEITLKDLEDFVDRTQMIIINAYDGEGYLIWSRV